MLSHHTIFGGHRGRDRMAYQNEKTESFEKQRSDLKQFLSLGIMQLKNI
jgi:hypothetical protein